MPGIAGIISKRPSDECESDVAAMIRSMDHERFYQSGCRSDKKMGAYVGWVAIEGAFAAGQLLENEHRDIELIMAGECYLDPEVGRKLAQQGHAIGSTPASWLVHLYEEQGDAFFQNLNGLFSGLLIDRRTGRLILFNDRFGFERLYYYETADCFFFASEAKALLRLRPELREFDALGVADYLTFGCTLDCRTLFRGVRLVPGGTAWTFEGTMSRKTLYFSPKSWEDQPVMDEQAFEEEFKQTFNRILPRYYQSPPSIGIALTGGLDTRMVLACQPPSSAPPVCYTYAGITGETLDVSLAAQVAAACALPHHPLRVGPDFFSEFGTLSDRTVFITDGTFSVLGAHEIYFNRIARNLAPVRLTGVFGSEVLRGMSTFGQQHLASELFSPAMQSQLMASAQRNTLSSDHPVTFAAFKEIPWNIGGSLAACRSQIIFRTPYLDNEIVALSYRAPSSLRKVASPAIRLIAGFNPKLAAIPTDRALLGSWSPMAKRYHRLVAEVTFKLDYYYNEGMPHALSRFDPMLAKVNSKFHLFGRHKHLNYRKWFRTELASYLSEALADPTIQESPFWNRDTIKTLGTDHIQGRKNRIREINAVLTIHAVERLLLRSNFT